MQPQNTLAYRLASNVSNGQSNTDPDTALREILSESRSIITGSTIPSEESIVRILEQSRDIVNIALSNNHTVNPADTKGEKSSPASSLLDIDHEGASASKTTQNPRSQINSKKSFRQRASTAISSMLNELLRDPKVFISPKILKYYTMTQCRLKKADHFPEIFSLYATKPAPQTSGSKITYRAVNPKSPQNAIPQDIADEALEVALKQKNLSLALAIVDNSFCTPAFHRSKVLRKTSIPAAGAVAMPPAAYMIASYIGNLQNTMDPFTATWGTFAGIIAYVTFTSSVGLVALITSNDQMQRVVWLPGMALRHRWLREEERAAMDKIAQAWGFKDPSLRGEEEGEEWNNLREFLGLKGMVLDRTDLMEGME